MLVDAPCSGLGRVQLGVPGSYSHWDGALRGAHGRRQRELLLRGAELLAAPDGASKGGGGAGARLVYSTCTLDPAENEQVRAGGGWAFGLHLGWLKVEIRAVAIKARRGALTTSLLSLQRVLRIPLYAASTPRMPTKLSAAEPRRYVNALLILRMCGYLGGPWCLPVRRQVVAWLLARMPNLHLVEPTLPHLPHLQHPLRLPHSPHLYTATWPAPASVAADRLACPALDGAQAAAQANTHGTQQAQGCGRALLMRDALEAHRPGCTHPAVLEGWDLEAAEAMAKYGDGDSSRSSSGAGGSRGKRARGRRQDGGGGVVGVEVVCGLAAGGPARRVARCPEALAEQLRRCCVRVAPGRSYEGFFIAEFVKL